jgi:hypothetical protein
MPVNVAVDAVFWFAVDLRACRGYPSDEDSGFLAPICPVGSTSSNVAVRPEETCLESRADWWVMGSASDCDNRSR